MYVYVVIFARKGVVNLKLGSSAERGGWGRMLLLLGGKVVGDASGPKSKLSRLNLQLISGVETSFAKEFVLARSPPSEECAPIQNFSQSTARNRTIS